MARSIAEIVVIVNSLTTYINDYLYLGELGESEAVVCFDCVLWNEGYQDEEADPVINIPPLKTTIIERLDEIIYYLEEVIADPEIADYGFKTQLQRFLDVIKDIKNKINAIQCEGPCPDINLLAQLLMTLVMTVTQIVTAMEMLNGLLAYVGTCGCLGDKFFELLIGRFINTITTMQCIVQDWSQLVMAFFQFQNVVAKSYVAAYVPKAPMPQPVIQQGMGFACVPCPPRPQPQCPPCNCNNGCTPFNPYC